MDEFIVIDGSSLLYRAFYALPLLTSAQGDYTNALQGFSNMLLRLLQEKQPALLAIAFDKSKKTFRNDLFAEYKGNRPKTPLEFSTQIPLLKELIRAWGIAFLEYDGYEADDIIGTLATKAIAKGTKTTIVTGDRDSFQLIRPGISVMFTKKGISDTVMVDEQVFQNKYGIKPQKLVDLKGLMGDSSDNIPGVPGIGIKTATRLLQEYDSLEAVLDNINNIKGQKLRERLSENKDIAILSKQLACIVCDMPLDFAEEDYHIQPDPQAVEAFSHQYDMKSFLRKFYQLYNINKKDLVQTDENTVCIPEFKVISNEKEATQLIDKTKKIGKASFAAVFKGGLPDIQLKSLALSVENDIFLVNNGTAASQIILSLISEKSLTKYMYGLKSFFLAGLHPAGNIIDVQLGAYLLNPQDGHYNIADLCVQYLGNAACPVVIDDIKTIIFNVSVLSSVAEKIWPLVQSLGMEKVYSDMELPLVEVLASMERAGVYINRENLSIKSEEASAIIDGLQNDIFFLAGKEFNINSTKQLGEVLFDTLKLPPGKKNHRGYSTDAETLTNLQAVHPIVDKILTYRLWTKLQSTYLDSMVGLINKVTSRVHTSFNQMVTATGRLSSSNPNLQNIPIRTEEGRTIRELFEPGNGYDFFLSGDYSQIELRLLAHMAQDENFLRAFNHDEDIHARTAAEVFGVPLSEVTEQQRQQAKIVNFGIIYGMSDYGLSKDLHISRKEAAIYIASYLDKCKGIKELRDKIISAAHKEGFVTTIFGRRRQLPAINSLHYNQRSLAERMALNTPIQGSAADIIKLAMIKVYRILQERKLKSRIVLQVHDELVLEVTAAEKEEVTGILQDTMEHIVSLSVPLLVDIHVGVNWAQVK